MKKNTFKENNRAELEKILADSRERLRQFRFKSGEGKTKNVKEGREIKRGIARVLTELNLVDRSDKVGNNKI